MCSWQMPVSVYVPDADDQLGNLTIVVLIVGLHVPAKENLFQYICSSCRPKYGQHVACTECICSRKCLFQYIIQMQPSIWVTQS